MGTILYRPYYEDLISIIETTLWRPNFGDLILWKLYYRNLIMETIYIYKFKVLERLIYVHVEPIINLCTAT